MGNCFQNDDADDVLFQGFRDAAVDDEIEKISLFGLSGSGKSTLYHNLQQLYEDPAYNHEEQLLHCKAIIRSNCLLYIAVLVRESEKKYHETADESYFIDNEDTSIREAIQLITKYIPYKFDQFTPPLPPPTPKPPPKSKHDPQEEPKDKPNDKSMDSEQKDTAIPIIRTAPKGTEPSTPNVMDEEDSSIHTENERAIRSVLNIDTPTVPEEEQIGSFEPNHLNQVNALNAMSTVHENENGDHRDHSDLEIELSPQQRAPRNIVEDVDPDENQQSEEDQEQKAREEQEQRDFLYAQELAAEFGFINQFEVEMDLVAIDHPNHWKRRYQDDDRPNDRLQSSLHDPDPEEDVKIEAYKYFDFDEFRIKQREWERNRHRNATRNQRRNNRNGPNNGNNRNVHPWMYDWDDDDDDDDDDSDDGPWYIRRRGRRQVHDVLSEELIDDFGAYFQYLNAQRVSDHDDGERETTIWEAFGHRAAVVAHHFDCKLNDHRNTIQYEQMEPEFVFSKEQRDKIYGDTSNKWVRSKYDSSSSDDEDTEERDEEKEEEVDIVRMVQTQSVPMEIVIKNGQIQALNEWDENMVRQKRDVLDELKRSDVVEEEIVVIEEHPDRDVIVENAESPDITEHVVIEIDDELQSDDDEVDDRIENNDDAVAVNRDNVETMNGTNIESLPMHDADDEMVVVETENVIDSIEKGFQCENVSKTDDPRSDNNGSPNDIEVDPLETAEIINPTPINTAIAGNGASHPSHDESEEFEDVIRDAFDSKEEAKDQMEDVDPDDIQHHEQETKEQASAPPLDSPLESVDTVDVGGHQVSHKQFWIDMQKLGESIDKIWNLPSIQQIYKNRHALFHVPSNMPYWFQHSAKIFHPKFVTTNQHLSLYRNHDGQIRSFEFNPDLGPRAELFDIPATTHELRTKYWTPFHCRNSNVIIFTASLVDVFHVCFEDHSQNAFYKSMQLFYEMLHGEYVRRNVQIVLLLTHKDRLIQYIRDGHSLRETFQKYPEWTWRPKIEKDEEKKKGDGDDDEDDLKENGAEMEEDQELRAQESVLESGQSPKVHFSETGGTNMKDVASLSNQQQSNVQSMESMDVDSIEKTVVTNTIDGMHQDFDRLMQSIERKEAENALPEHELHDDNGLGGNALDDVVLNDVEICNNVQLGAGGKSVSPMEVMETEVTAERTAEHTAEPRISGEHSSGGDPSGDHSNERTAENHSNVTPEKEHDDVTRTNLMAELTEEMEFTEEERMERRLRSVTKESKSALSPAPITPNGSMLATPQESNGHHNASLYPFPEEEEVIDLQVETEHEEQRMEQKSDELKTEEDSNRVVDMVEMEMDVNNTMNTVSDGDLDRDLVPVSKEEDPDRSDRKHEDEMELKLNAITRAKCPMGHPLEKIDSDDPRARMNGIFVCDICGSAFDEGDVRYECRMDNWDLCEKCHDEQLRTLKKKLRREMSRGPVWVLEEYKGVEYKDRLQTPKSDVERALEREQQKKSEIKEEEKKDKDYEHSSGAEEYDEDEKDDEKMSMEIIPKGTQKETKIGETIWEQIQRQTKPKPKREDKEDPDGNGGGGVDEGDENWKYILSGDKRLTYDGSAFDDDRWAMETFNGYCDWIRDMYLKCKDIEDSRTIYCHVVNLVNQDDIETTMYDLSGVVFSNWQRNWALF